MIRKRLNRSQQASVLFEALEARLLATVATVVALAPQVFPIAVGPMLAWDHSRLMLPTDKPVVQELDKGNPHNQPPTITPVLPPPNPPMITLANPSDIGTSYFYDPLVNTLWGDLGTPTMVDVNQGGLGFCWGDGPLQSMAWNNPARLKGMMTADPAGGFDGKLYGTWYHIADGFPWFSAHIGPNHALWPLVAEKLLACYFGTYNALNGGWMTTSVQAFSWNVSSYFMPDSDVVMAKLFNDSLANHIALTIGTNSASPNLVGSHCYSIVGVSIGAGPTGENLYLLRNPWGVDGVADPHPNAASNPNDGLVSLTWAEIAANAYVSVVGEQ
jgi:hypothetical protein